MDEWYSAATQALTQHAQSKISTKGGAGSAKVRKQMQDAAQLRSAQLATSSDKVGVSFAGASFQEKYYATKFERRGKLLYEVMSDLSLEFRDSEVVNVASFGGGPGTDASGLVWLQQERHPSTTFYCTLYDREPTWKRYVQLLGQLFASAGKVCLNSAVCDVTTKLDHNSNYKVDLADVDLMLFFYVCHETSSLASQAGHCFYADVARLAKPGAVVVIADVMQHSQSAIAEVVSPMQAVRQIESLPTKRSHNACVCAFRFT